MVVLSSFSHNLAPPDLNTGLSPGRPDSEPLTTRIQSDSPLVTSSGRLIFELEPCGHFSLFDTAIGLGVAVLQVDLVDLHRGYPGSNVALFPCPASFSGTLAVVSHRAFALPALVNLNVPCARLEDRHRKNILCAI